MEKIKGTDTYYLEGIVEHGKALGRTVGMPTVNLRVEKGTIPPDGVYASRMTVRGQTYRGLTHVGCRPSVDTEKKRTIETYLLHFSEDIYGERVGLEVDFFIRETRKFRDVGEVRRQVEEDIKAAGIS